MAKTSDSQVQQVANWIINKAISGVPPLSSAEHLAKEYLIDPLYPHNDDRVWSLINWETTKNFTSGFITGFGGLLTLPVAIPAAFGASWIIQARMAGAIAHIYGHSLKSDRVRTFVLASLLGDAAKEVLKKLASKWVKNLLKG
jgi:EcsC protein family